MGAVMGVQDAQAPALVEAGVAWSALAGEGESGDQHLVKPFPNGTLVAVVDALGHGQGAAAAAKLAIATLEASPRDSVIALLERCDRELRKTRGVAVTLASFDARQNAMTWLAVGNVEGVLLSADREGGLTRESVLLRGGVVGYRLPPLRAAVLTVRPGDTLVLATDGIRSDFIRELTPGMPPQGAADRILARHRKDRDDALVLVARYLGGER